MLKLDISVHLYVFFFVDPSSVIRYCTPFTYITSQLLSQQKKEPTNSHTYTHTMYKEDLK